MTYELPDFLSSKLTLGPRKHNVLHVARKAEVSGVQRLKDGVAVSFLKSNLLIFAPCVELLTASFTMACIERDI